jgi:NADPH:quinone reductase-like Zn-dependent oxidoreductase
MKAIVYQKYGFPDVLQLKEVEKPTPKDNEVLVKVHAASVNSWNWDLLRGTPFLVRLGGLLKLKYKIPGAEIAGRVIAVGSNVKQFQPGDEVFGDLTERGWGGFAEYVCARENALARKPANMTFEEVAAVPQAAVLALQSLRDNGQVQPGQKVLINVRVVVWVRLRYGCDKHRVNPLINTFGVLHKYYLDAILPA